MTWRRLGWWGAEASVDLDILGRDALLQFLREESEGRGVTVLYCTHILDGLDGWASHHVHLYKGEHIQNARECIVISSHTQRAHECTSMACAMRTCSEASRVA